MFDRSAPAPDLLSAAAVVYLLAPLLVISATWLWWPVALLSGAAVVGIGVLTLKGAVRPGLRPAVAGWCLILAVVAVVWSGSSPLVGSIPFLDLAKHRWIYGDLVRQPWPVVYEGGILRYSFAFYTVPAALARLIGAGAQSLLLAWMALGTALFLGLAARQAKTLAGALLFPVIALLFSGLDTVGVHLSPFHEPAWLRFQEDWAYHPQGWLIGSSVFGLGWSPQHTIPAWLAGALLLENHQSRWFRRLIGPLAVALLMWSPFVALSFGAVAGLLLLVSRDRSAAIRSACHPATLAAAAGLALWIIPYLSADSTTIPTRLTLGTEAAFPYIGRYVAFVALEFLIYAALAVWALGRVPIVLAVGVAVLLALPLAFVGAANDLMMRGAALPMVFVLFVCLRALSVGVWPARIALATTLALGTTAAVNEWSRLMTTSPTPGDWARPITAMDPQFVSQYVAKVPFGLATKLMKMPRP